MNDREKAKEQQEKEILSSFLSLYPALSNTEIEKRTRPDYVLHSETGLTYGIEITRLTTELEQVHYSIMRDTFGKRMNAEEARHIAARHGEKAYDYNYYDADGSLVISSPLYDVNELIKFFTDQIAKKYIKYKDIYKDFSSFYILCDARTECAISSLDDAEELFCSVDGRIPDDMNIAILYTDEDCVVRCAIRHRGDTP